MGMAHVVPGEAAQELDLMELEQSPGAQSSGIVVIPPFLALVLGQTFLAWQLQGIMESWNALGGKGS